MLRAKDDAERPDHRHFQRGGTPSSCGVIDDGPRTSVLQTKCQHLRLAPAKGPLQDSRGKLVGCGASAESGSKENTSWILRRPAKNFRSYGFRNEQLFRDLLE